MNTQRVRLFLLCLSIAAASAALAFVLLSLLAMQLEAPPVRSFDLGVQGAVHGWQSGWLTAAMKLFSLIGSTEAFIPTLLLTVVLALRQGAMQQGQRLVRKRQVAGVFAMGVGGALVLNETFKHHFHRVRPRPSWALAVERTFSFPSGHALFSMVLYGLIAYLFMARRGRRWQRAALALGAAGMILAIGTSRIYLGVHWPTDVLAGYTTGAVWLTGVILIDRLWRTHWLRSRANPL